MTFALAQPRAELKPKPARVEPTAEPVQVRTVVMGAVNASGGAVLALELIRPGVAHGHHCTVAARSLAERRVPGPDPLLPFPQPEGAQRALGPTHIPRRPRHHGNQQPGRRYPGGAPARLVRHKLRRPQRQPAHPERPSRRRGSAPLRARPVVRPTSQRYLEYEIALEV
jgi:hypothetical protein